MSERITLSHGNGGKYMRRLVADIFSHYLDNDFLDIETDAATLPADNREIMTTVDGFTVQPIIFPGGNIGSLCIHGTVNDLAVSGAVAQYLTLGVIIEEGLSLETLELLVKSMADTAKECGVKIVCGDTKVVPRGQARDMESEVYFTTTGIGYKASSVDYSTKNIQPGDKIIISGSIGDHGAAIMLAREQFGLSGNLLSDSASVLPFCQSVYELDGIRFMRDPTRGGVATILHELNQSTGYGMQMNEAEAPLKDEVITICEMLGYEPYYLANEGRVVAIVEPAIAEQVLKQWQNIPGGEQAALIGEVTEAHQQVVLKTALGGERIIHELSDSPLPRIC